MTCEKWQNRTMELAKCLSDESPDKKAAAALATDLALSCVPYIRSHTSRILAELSGIQKDPDEIPEFLRKTPAAQDLLLKYKVIESIDH